MLGLESANPEILQSSLYFSYLPGSIYILASSFPWNFHGRLELEPNLQNFLFCVR
jgi:hypothetical protein